MKTLLSGLAATALAMTIGCTQSTPGGPGVTAVPNSSGGTTTVAKKPIIGEADDTFKMNTPGLVLSPVENGGAFRGKIWMKMAAHMRAVR